MATPVDASSKAATRSPALQKLAHFPSPRLCILFAAAAAICSTAVGDAQDRVKEKLDERVPAWLELYRHLHANPELSFHEEETARTVAFRLRDIGFDVTEKVGGHGVVGIYKNGSGSTVMVRADMDALPVEEQTGLSYASKVRTQDDAGNDVPVMHACGHDMHMTVFLGVAETLAALKEQWRGTLMFVAQPAEERGAGARAMLSDGLFERFNAPDYALALHVAANVPAGTISYVSGYALANVDSVDITIRGVGGHGAYPHTTKDPVTLAAQTVLALQTIVSRETNPTEPAVVTVGSIHGGTKHNIIPDEVKLQLTLRSYTDAVREQTIASIRRITRGLGLAAGLDEDRLPIVEVKDEFTPATYNDPELIERLDGVFKRWLGEGNVLPGKPVMGGEDFGRYGRTEEQVPICMFWLGAVSPKVVRQSMAGGKSLPSLHSPFFAPDPEPALRTGVTAMTAAVLELAN